MKTKPIVTKSDRLLPTAAQLICVMFFGSAMVLSAFDFSSATYFPSGKYPEATAVGDFNADVHIASNDADESPFDVTHQGAGTFPEIAVEQPAGMEITTGASRDFGSVGIGDYATIDFTIKNTGNDYLYLGFGFTGPDATEFSKAWFESFHSGGGVAPFYGGGRGVAPGSSGTFPIAFEPRSLGAKTATLCISSNDPDDPPICITLQGEATHSPLTTTAASSITSAGATLNGIVNLRGDRQRAHAFFEYGTSTAYGSKTFPIGLGNVAEPVPVSFNVAGLDQSTPYHYRLVVAHVFGNFTYPAFYGDDQTFTTPSTVSPPAWYSTQVTAVSNAADGSRTGAAHPGESLYFYKGTDNNSTDYSNIWACQWDGAKWAQVQLSRDYNVDDWLAFGTQWNLLCYKGKDNRLYALYFNGSAWVVAPLGTNDNVAGDVTVDNTWNLIHYRGTDSRVWTTWWTGSQWAQASLGGLGNVEGGLAVDPRHHLVYYQGSGNEMWCYWWTGTAWVQCRMANTFNVGGALAATSGGGMAHYRSSDDNSAWAVNWNGSEWVQTQLDPLAEMGATNAIAPLSENSMLYLNTSDQCHAEYWNGTSWGNVRLGDGGFGLTGGLSVQRSSNLAFARRSDGHVVIFYYR
jgi:hypothetical protein